MPPELHVEIIGETLLPELLPLARTRDADMQFLVDRLRYHREKIRAVWLGLRAGSQFVGWGVLHLDAEPHYNYPELEDRYVSPEHRNKGYGTYLIAAIERLARERGLAGLSLGVSPDDNADAQRLYERLGYRQDGGEKRLDGVYGDYEEWTIGLEKKF